LGGILHPKWFFGFKILKDLSGNPALYVKKMKTEMTSLLRKMKKELFLLFVVVSVVFISSCGDDGFKDAINGENGGSSPSPGNSGVVSASYSLPTILDVHWESARDDLTSSSELQYRIFASTTVFSSYNEALSDGVELTGGWTLGLSSLSAYIPSATVYGWCNVFVRDEDGNITAYNGTVPISSANTPPSPGGSGHITGSSTLPLIADLSWTKASDAETPVASLRYRVFYGASPSDVNTFAHAEASGTEITSGWVNDIALIQATLPSGGNWWFNVFVMDGGGLVEGYVQERVTVLPPSANTPPSPGGTGHITGSSTVPLIADLSWTKASDAETPVASLRYRVFYGASPSDVNTFAHAEASGIEITSGWVNDIASIQATLPSGGDWWFNVFVMDGGGLVEGYVQERVTVLPPSANTPPSPGGTGHITGSSTLPLIADLSWRRASDAETPVASLRYRVFYGASPSDVNTFAHAEASGIEITSGWVNDIAMIQATLPSGGDWWFNVFVMDGGGLVERYVQERVTVLP
jgi:hypothetical protein